MKFIKPRLAATLLLALQALVVLFHLTILFGLVPYEIVWGGKLSSCQEMFVFESVSIALNLFIMLLLSVYLEIIKWSWPAKLMKVLFWVFASLFALNTLGNLAAESVVEMIVFTPLTLVTSLLFLSLALEKK
mgnify:CR=1 FL=1